MLRISPVSMRVVFILPCLAAMAGEVRGDRPVRQLSPCPTCVAELNDPSERMGEAELRQQELERVADVLERLGGAPELARSLLTAARTYEMDPLFIAAVTFVESSFKPNAKSSRGARGLMQIKPVVMEIMGVSDPWDPHQNVMAGSGYLRYCFERYRHLPNATFLALAAYNVGPGKADKLAQSEPAKRFVNKVLRIYNALTEKQVAGESAPARPSSR
jgi:soluble lytic murein transglycosylase-like protein